MNYLIELDFLVRYRDKVITDGIFDYAIWELTDDTVILVYPWFKIYKSKADLPPLPPGSSYCTQVEIKEGGVKDYCPKKYMKKKKWWQIF